MNRTNTRIFTHETYEALRKGLAALGSVYEFTGRESDTRIMDIFANTALIVGYHGAGFANAFYSPNGTCVIEISTEEDLSGSKPWRTNSVAISERIANRVRWVTTNINLKPLLEANGIMAPAQAKFLKKDPNHKIKNLKKVSMLRHEISSVLQIAKLCFTR